MLRISRRAALLFLIFVPCASAQTPDKPWELLAPLHTVKLDNGMTFLLYPNKRAPIFSGVIRFDVGGKNELPGQTGIAHMFEHMAFKGTPTVGTKDWEAEQGALRAVDTAAAAFDSAREKLVEEGVEDPNDLAEKLAGPREAFEKAKADAAQFVVKNEFDEIYQREGGSEMNATTSSDATTYFLSLPANRIGLWAAMESQRLARPVMREFYTERDVVMEERRMRTDNDPSGKFWETTMAIAFMASPYGRPTVGYGADIRNLKAGEAMEFFRRNYTPDRAVGAIVGDIDIEKTEALLRETFGKLPPAPADAVPPRLVPEPAQEGERRSYLRIKATPMLMMGWHKPAAPSIDDVRAEALIALVTGGRSARWFEKLVKQDKLAADLEAFTAPGDALPNLFMVYATPQGDTQLEDLEKAIRAEVKRLRDDGVTAEELESAKKRLRADTTRTLENNLGLAQSLVQYAQMSGDPYYLERRLRQLETLTAEELKAFAAKYLIDDNLTVSLLLPPDAEK